MKVITDYPVIIDNEKVSPVDYYSSAAGTNDKPENEYNVGDLTVQTNYPVIIDEKDVSPKDYYSNLTAEERRQERELRKKRKNEPSIDEQKDKASKGLFWDKVKGVWSKAKDNPAAQFAFQQAAAYLAQKNAGSGYSSGPEAPTTPPADDENDQKMSTPTKVLLVTGSILVVGYIIYAVMGANKGAK